MEALKLFKAETLFSKDSQARIIVAAPFVYLSALAKISSKVELAAQDIFYKEKGPFTGEISPSMLKNFGVKLAIIGHSERRQLFSETDKDVNEKLKTALAAGLSVAVCVGEKEKMVWGKASSLILKQVKAALLKIDLKKEKGRILIAYEPIWAIGTGESATPDYASRVAGLIKKSFPELPVLYGGSVNGGNIKEFMAARGIAGALVGGASLKLDETKAILNKIN